MTSFLFQSSVGNHMSSSSHLIFARGAAVFDVHNLLGRGDTEYMRHSLANHDVIFNANANALIPLWICWVARDVKSRFCSRSPWEKKKECG